MVHTRAAQSVSSDQHHLELVRDVPISADLWEVRTISVSWSAMGWVWRSQGVTLGWRGLEVPIGPVFPPWALDFGAGSLSAVGASCALQDVGSIPVPTH